MTNRHRPSFDSLPPKARGLAVENMKERIYATITLLAVIATLWHDAAAHTVIGSIGAVIGAVAALWLATIISTRLSHRAVHGRRITYREYAHSVYAASGLLAPAAFPVLIIAGSATGLYELKTALAVGLAGLLLSLLLISLLAGRRIYAGHPWRLMIVSAAELSVGVGVILLKVALGD